MSAPSMSELPEIPTQEALFIDRYEVVGRIASGGMATVHLARLSGAGGFQRLFAIKQLHQHLADNKEFVDMFLDEARLAASIHHPNVVPILEVGTGERGYYLVMEYIEGGTLVSLIGAATAKEVTIPIPIVNRLMLDLLAGLHEAHELNDADGNPAGLVHRDVSPHNVLIGVDGITRITDFGVARAAARLSGTRVGQLKGKIAYMAPEQVIGDVEVDRRADVFAAGVVMWEALSLRRLFKGKNEASTLSAVLHKPLVTPRRDLDAALEAVCLKALARSRDDRYATCAEFAEALETAARGSQGIASSKEVAKLVRDLLGDQIGEQRASVRRPRTDSHSSTGSGSGSLGGSASGPGSGSGSVSRAGSRSLSDSGSGSGPIDAASPASSTLTRALLPGSTTLPSADASGSGVVVPPSAAPKRGRVLIVGGLAAAAVISVGVWFALPSVVARPNPDASAVTPKPSVDARETATATAAQPTATVAPEAPPASAAAATTESKSRHRVYGPAPVAPPKATPSAAAAPPAPAPTPPPTSKGRVFREDL
ncbi:MAG: serine/threonine protein kinase [Polyangiaceae bacterium]|nr:serine/threonine protein kinase [Polyangiaceae bacterium]